MLRWLHNIFYSMKIQILTRLYSRIVSSCGGGTIFYGRVKIINPQNVFIGCSSTINENVLLNASEVVTIGNCCHISSGVTLHTGSLILESDYKNRPHIHSAIEIKDGCWICSNVTVCQGVVLGEGSVVAAGAVVHKDIPPFELWGGIPARKIRNLR